MILFAILTLTFLMGATLVAGLICCLDEQDRRLKRAFAALFVVGCITGVWCTFFFEYQPSAGLRILGFPMPVMIFKLQNGNWVDYVGGPLMFVNLIIVPALIAMPLSLALFIRRIRRRNAERTRGFPVAPRQPM